MRLLENAAVSKPCEAASPPLASGLNDQTLRIRKARG